MCNGFAVQCVVYGMEILKYANERTGNGRNEWIYYCTYTSDSIATSHSARYRSLVASRPHLKLCYPPLECPVWKSIIPKRFLQLSLAFSSISPTENGYFNVRALFMSGHIHLARRLTNN